MAIMFNVMAKSGEYTTKDGQQKTRWHKCGVAIEAKNDGGMALNIESLPTNFDGWLQLYKPKDETGQQSSQKQPDADFGDAPF